MACSLRTSLETQTEYNAVMFESPLDDEAAFTKRLTREGRQELRANCGNNGIYFQTGPIMVGVIPFTCRLRLSEP